MSAPIIAIGFGAGDCLIDNTSTKYWESKLGCGTGRDCVIDLACDGPEIDLDNPPVEPFWWCEDDPDSMRFAGFYVTRVDGLDALPFSREIYEGACEGGSFGRPRIGMREVVFEVIGIGSDCAGASFGKRFLQSKLLGECGTVGCNEGGSNDLTITQWCAVEGEDEPREDSWTLNNASLASPFEFESLCGCSIWKATFSVFTDPFFVQCQDEECEVTPGLCDPDEPCIDPDIWSRSYIGKDSIYEGACPEEVVATNANLCEFPFTKPRSPSGLCDPCVSVNLSPAGECCPITAGTDTISFEVTIINGSNMYIRNPIFQISTRCPSDADPYAPAYFLMYNDGLHAGEQLRSSGGTPLREGNGYSVLDGTVEGDARLPGGCTFQTFMKIACEDFYHLDESPVGIKAIVSVRRTRMSI